jgi:hypothetical protein
LLNQTNVYFCHKNIQFIARGGAAQKAMNKIRGGGHRICPQTAFLCEMAESW